MQATLETLHGLRLICGDLGDRDTSPLGDDGRNVVFAHLDSWRIGLTTLVNLKPSLVGLHKGTHLRDRSSFIQEIDRLIREEAVGNVPICEKRRCGDGVIRVHHPMVLFVTILQPGQDLGALERRRLGNVDRLEAPLERRVLFNVPAVLGDGRRANALELAAGERWLEQVGGVDRPLSGSGAYERVQLVDEEDCIVRCRHLVDHFPKALLELSTVLCVCDEESELQ